jgi:hypothetical protein
MEGNPILNLMKIVFVDLIGEFLYFPIWWLTVGLKKTWIFFVSQVLYFEASLSVKVWIVNLFRPMYMQTDIAGRLISFFMRLFQIIVRSAALVFFIVVVAVASLVWFFSPLIIIWLIGLSLGLYDLPSLI